MRRSILFIITLLIVTTAFAGCSMITSPLESSGSADALSLAPVAPEATHFSLPPGFTTAEIEVSSAAKDYTFGVIGCYMFNRRLQWVDMGIRGTILRCVVCISQRRRAAMYPYSSHLFRHFCRRDLRRHDPDDDRFVRFLRDRTVCARLQLRGTCLHRLARRQLRLCDAKCNALFDVCACTIYNRNAARRIHYAPDRRRRHHPLRCFGAGIRRQDVQTLGDAERRHDRRGKYRYPIRHVRCRRILRL